METTSICLATGKPTPEKIKVEWPLAVVDDWWEGEMKNVFGFSSDR